jgi:hypothetical protein
MDDLQRLMELQATYEAMRRRHRLLLQLQAAMEDLPAFFMSGGRLTDDTAESFEEVTLRRAILVSLLEAQEKNAGPPPVTEADLQQLRHRTLAAPAGDCTVCLETMTYGTMVCELPCAHLFCKGCAHKWLLQHRTCPVCRYEVNFSASSTAVDPRTRTQSTGTSSPPVAQAAISAASFVQPQPPTTERFAYTRAPEAVVPARIPEEFRRLPTPMAHAARPAMPDMTAAPHPAPAQVIGDRPQRLTFVVTMPGLRGEVAITSSPTEALLEEVEERTRAPRADRLRSQIQSSRFGGPAMQATNAGPIAAQARRRALAEARAMDEAEVLDSAILESLTRCECGATTRFARHAARAACRSAAARNPPRIPGRTSRSVGGILPRVSPQSGQRINHAHTAAAGPSAVTTGGRAAPRPEPHRVDALWNCPPRSLRHTHRRQRSRGQLVIATSHGTHRIRLTRREGAPRAGSS